jgi:hypothetical protein
MTAIFILIVLAAGYLAVTKHPYVKYRLHRYEGQQLYLLTIYWGMKCLFLSLVIYFSLIYLSECKYFTWLNFFSILEKSIISKLSSKGLFVEAQNEMKDFIWMLSIMLLSCFSAYILKIFGHLGLLRKYRKWTADSFVIASILADSPLDKLIVASFFCTDHKQKNFLLMLTMEDKKVYVGKVVDCGEPSETGGIDQEILIVPMLSGYRDQSTQKVIFTTHYAILPQIITLVLPQDGIKSVTPFSSSAYDEFQKQSRSEFSKQLRLPNIDSLS